MRWRIDGWIGVGLDVRQRTWIIMIIMIIIIIIIVMIIIAIIIIIIMIIHIYIYIYIYVIHSCIRCVRESEDRFYTPPPPPPPPPHGLVYRSFCLNSSTLAVSKVTSRRWWCIESLFPTRQCVKRCTGAQVRERERMHLRAVKSAHLPYTATCSPSVMVIYI